MEAASTSCLLNLSYPNANTGFYKHFILPAKMRKVKCKTDSDPLPYILDVFNLIRWEELLGDSQERP